MEPGENNGLGETVAYNEDHPIYYDKNGRPLFGTSRPSAFAYGHPWPPTPTDINKKRVLRPKTLPTACAEVYCPKNSTDIELALYWDRSPKWNFNLPKFVTCPVHGQIDTQNPNNLEESIRQLSANKNGNGQSMGKFGQETGIHEYDKRMGTAKDLRGTYGTGIDLGNYETGKDSGNYGNGNNLGNYGAGKNLGNYGTGKNLGIYEKSEEVGNYGAGKELENYGAGKGLGTSGNVQDMGTYGTGNGLENYGLGKDLGIYGTGKDLETSGKGGDLGNYGYGEELGNYGTGKDFPTYDTDKALESYGIGKENGAYDTDKALESYGIGKDLGTYDTDKALESYGIGKDLGTYDTDKALESYGIGKENGTYGAGKDYGNYGEEMGNYGGMGADMGTHDYSKDMGNYGQSSHQDRPKTHSDRTSSSGNAKCSFKQPVIVSKNPYISEKKVQVTEKELADFKSKPTYFCPLHGAYLSGVKRRNNPKFRTTVLKKDTEVQADLSIPTSNRYRECRKSKEIGVVRKPDNFNFSGKMYINSFPTRGISTVKVKKNKDEVVSEYKEHYKNPKKVADSKKVK